MKYEGGDQIYFTIDQNSRGALQLAIRNPDGGGYRISGPKYDGTGKTLRIHPLGKRDIDELRKYLRIAEQTLKLRLDSE